jgi:hypothetical protein
MTFPARRSRSLLQLEPQPSFNKMVRQSVRVVILGGLVLCGVALSGHSLLSYISGTPLWSIKVFQSPFQGEDFSWETVKSPSFDIEPDP